jgi:hypothetical protein
MCNQLDLRGLSETCSKRAWRYALHILGKSYPAKLHRQEGQEVHFDFF